MSNATDKRNFGGLKLQDSLVRLLRAPASGSGYVIRYSYAFAPAFAITTLWRDTHLQLSQPTASLAPLVLQVSCLINLQLLASRYSRGLSHIKRKNSDKLFMNEY